MSNQTICLNMIVKDESHVIEETLNNLCEKIKFDYWVICDTGSSDNTPNIIKNFFEKKNINGELHFDEWKDFAYNRTLALKYAYEKTDYLLVFDADDEIHGDFKLPEILSHDAYQFNFGSDILKYGRILLINNRKKFNFVGVLHEYINFEDENTEYTMSHLDGNYFVISGRKGNRNKDPQKYLKDALILEKAFQEEFDKKNDIYKRYAFYCGNSYYDYNDKDNALIWYKKTLQISDNNQEKYISARKIYEIYKEKNQEDTGIPFLIMGLHYDNERYECAYNLIMYYVKLGMFDIAYNFFCFINYSENFNYTSKTLSEPKVYEYDIPNIMIYVGGKLGKTELIHKMYNRIFTKKFQYFEIIQMRNLLINHNIFVKLFDENNKKNLELFDQYISFLESKKINLKPYENFILKSRLYLSIEKNYKICNNDKKNILIYVGNSPFDWNLTYVKNNAIGGSEFCASSLAESLSKVYNVFVVGKVISENKDDIYFVDTNSNENIITIDFLLETTKFEFTIVSRFLDYFITCRNIKTKNTYLWAHDCGFAPANAAKEILNFNDDKIDCCVCLTEWQKNMFENKYPSLKNKIKIIGNGLDLDEFPQIEKKIKNRFIYTSSSERGLINIVKKWGEIIDFLPDAELYIASYNKFPDEKKDCDKEIHEIMKKYNSIKHVGKLNKKELYNLMSLSEYWFYPTNFPETFCITAMEMLKSGVICIYYPFAGLVNTIGNYGFPVDEKTELDIIKKIALLPDKEKNKIKQRGIEYANNSSWKIKSKQWEMLNLMIDNVIPYDVPICENVEKLFVRKFEFENFKLTKKIINLFKRNHLQLDKQIIETLLGNISVYLNFLLNNDDYCIISEKNIICDGELNNLIKMFLESDYELMNLKTNSAYVIKKKFAIDFVENIKKYSIEYNIKKCASVQNINFVLKIVDADEEQINCLLYGEGVKKINRININGNTKNKNIAVFNSFPFHYEMFGYIIFYCSKNNFNLTIYTNNKNDLGWLKFYKQIFCDFNFEYKSVNKFENDKHLFDIIFIPTDDDFGFDNKWITDKCITIDHTLMNRRPQIKNHIGTRLFLNSDNEWALPCFECLNIADKTNSEEEHINIAIIGCTKINIDVINRLTTSNASDCIKLHVCGRVINFINLNDVKKNISIENHNNIDTFDLIKLLKMCDYVLTDCCPNVVGNFDHTEGKSMSGAVPLAFSTLTPLILNSNNNKLYKFQNVIEFDFDSNLNIYVDKNIIDVEKLNEERKKLILMFDDNISQKTSEIPKSIIQTWENKNFEPEFQKLIDTWKYHNPNYEHIVFDKYEREDFIRNNFDKDVLDTYNSIIPGAYKVDLFRYCYLYINGGVYVDVDTKCLGSLDKFLLQGIEFVVPIDLNLNPREGKHNLACGFIASIPGHPVLLNCINSIVYNIKNKINFESKLDFTGPGMLGRSVNKYIGNKETESFVDKDGISNKIHYLKFEQGTEYVKNKDGDILFQNKNGNQEIIKLYNIECMKLKNYVGWTNCKNNVNYNNNKKNIAISTFGQFR